MITEILPGGVFAQVVSPDPTSALAVAVVMVLGAAFLSVLQRFASGWDRLSNQRYDELDRKCREIGDKLWLLEERVKHCESSECPLKKNSSPTSKDPS